MASISTMLTYKQFMNGLTDIPGIRVGQITDLDAITGCTVVICEGMGGVHGAIGGVDIRGGATGTEEIDTLSPGHVTDRVHAIVLSGGSAFGLETASGVRRYLERHGIGFDTGNARVPIVPCAILYDLGIGTKSHVRPNREMGEAACGAATTGLVNEGNVGAGTGATVGKLFGIDRAMKGGVGTFTVKLGSGVLVSALVAVNALGDVRNPGTGQIVAGARTGRDAREFVNTSQAMKQGATGGFSRHNTTLAVVATNAALTKVAAGRLAQSGSLGIARAIDPVNTMADGDVTFALSIGDAWADLGALGVAAAEAVSEAIVRAVRAAKTLGGVPGLGSWS